MAHIAIEDGIPGILGPMKFRPETTKPLRELAEALLRGPSTLSSAERETIAAFVSSRNDCRFCQLSHSAAAAEHLGGDDAHYALVDSVKSNFASADISPKLKALLAIDDRVRQTFFVELHYSYGEISNVNLGNIITIQNRIN